MKITFQTKISNKWNFNQPLCDLSGNNSHINNKAGVVAQSLTETIKHMARSNPIVSRSNIRKYVFLYDNLQKTTVYDGKNPCLEVNGLGMVA